MADKSIAFSELDGDYIPIKGMQQSDGTYSIAVGDRDASTDALITIDYAHHEIHEGKHFKAGFSSTLASGGTIGLAFVTPNSLSYAHWTLTAQSTMTATIVLYESATLSNNGTAVTVWNRNRNSANTAGTLAYHTPTVTSAGTAMVTKWIGGTGFKTAVGGEARGDSEFVLKKNTKYLIVGTANEAGKLAIGGDWYEHEDIA